MPKHLLQLPEKGNARAHEHLPDWHTQSKEPQNLPVKGWSWFDWWFLHCQLLEDPAENSQVLCYLLVSFCKSIRESGSQGSSTSGCLLPSQGTKCSWNFMLLWNKIIFPFPLCSLTWASFKINQRSIWKQKSHIKKYGDIKKSSLIIFAHFCTLIVCLKHCFVN